MKLQTIGNVLVIRDGYTYEEANQELDIMRTRVKNGEDPEDILYEIGLEPDYIYELL